MGPPTDNVLIFENKDQSKTFKNSDSAMLDDDTYAEDYSETNDTEEDEDEEFRRAQEMALAVAALAPKAPTQWTARGRLGRSLTRRKRNKNSHRKAAEEIKLAVADVICASTSTNIMGESSSAAALFPKKKGRNKRGSKSTMEKEEPPEFNVLRHLLGKHVEDNLIDNDYYLELEGKVLHGWDLVSCLAVVHLVLLYFLCWVPYTTLEDSAILDVVGNFIQAAFMIDMAFVFCMTNNRRYTRVVSDSSKLGKTPAVVTTKSSSKKKKKKGIKSSTTAEDSQKKTIPSSEASADALSTETIESVEQLLPLEPESRIKLEWLDNISFQVAHLTELEQLQPTSTLAERRRFLKARKHVVKAASAQLGEYLEWRTTNRIDEFFPSTCFTTDEEDWKHAARGAMEIGNTSGKAQALPPLPRIVSVFEDDLAEVVLCKQGARIVHVLPCVLESSLASNATYALAVAMYLDRKLDRSCTEKVTVVIDIRAGQGWSNPSSVSIVPFIKLVVGLLNTYFPERLSRCILYPLPFTATLLFNKAKDYLDPDTAAKIQVCSGAGSVQSPVPEKVFEFIGPKAMECMEERRRSLFR
mmetsp:Transcript_13745/g.33289  ORF Transcript_13745/g.33289 Transcript_13745/m.33289 type:complete len:583 (-) Transcript_13745:821-2569(-)